MSRRAHRFLLAVLLPLLLGAASATAQTFPVSFQKASDIDDSVLEIVGGFPPARDCALPCQTAHFICRIVNCSAVDADGNCVTPWPDAVTNGVFQDTPPITLPLDCSRGVTVTGSGAWDPPTCDPATNTVRVENIRVPPGGNVIVSFWCAVACDEGMVRNMATFDYEQNPGATPLEATDPLATSGVPGLTFRVGNPSTAGVTKDAPSLPIQANERLGPPGATVEWIIEATNSNCEPVTLAEIYDIPEDPACMTAVCGTLRLFLDGVPTPLPPGSECPSRGDRLWTIGSLVVQPHQAIRITFDGTLTLDPMGSTCCNTAYVQAENGPLLMSSDPGLDSMLIPESTCITYFGIQLAGDAVKRAEDILGNEITTVSPGDEIYWRFIVRNDRAIDFVFDLRDTFPPEAVLGPGAIVMPFPSGTCAVAGQDLTCTGVTAPPSSSVEMLVRSTLDCTGQSGGIEICNEGVVTSPTLFMPVPTHCPSCVGDRPFNLTCVTLQAPTFEFASKTVTDDSGNGRVAIGEILHYAINALNSGTSAATSVVIRDVLPAGLSHVAGTLALDGVPLSDAADADDGEVVAGVVTVRIASLAPLVFGVGQVTFDARLDTRTGPEVCNGASIEYTEAAACGLGAQVVPDACLPVEPIIGPPQLSSVKSVTPAGTVDAGTLLHYSIGTCNGPAAGAATGVVVTDIVPVGTTYVAGSMLLAGAPLSDAADADAGTLVAGPPDSLSFALGTLATGECLIAEFDVLIDLTATGLVTNVAQFAANGVAATDSNSVITPINVIMPPADLSATKSSVIVGGPPLLVNGVISYLVRVCNATSAGPATDVTIADAIPLDALTGCGGAFVPGSIRVDGAAQTDAADGDLARFEAAPAPGAVVAILPTLGPGECVDLTFDVAAMAGCDDTERVLNVATASAVGLPSITTNQTSDAVSANGGGTDPTLMRKEGFPLVNRCTAFPAPCGCEVGPRLDPVLDDCVTAGTCTQLDPVTWRVPGDLQVHVPLVFYAVFGDGCVAAGDATHLVVRKSLPDDIIVQIIP